MFKRFLSLTFVVVSATISGVYAQKEQRTELPKQINSPHSELRPLISGDGNTLYFGREQHPDNVRGLRDLQDVYVVQKEGDSWGTPRNLGAPINNKFVNSIFSVSPDGQELLIVNTYREVQGPFVYFRKLGNAWSEPEEVDIEGYYNASEYVDFFQSYRENVLFMAIARDDSHGEQDIFISFRKADGNWSKPRNLGKTINTSKSDFAPFLASDGQTLFFSSYGHQGRGGADIYYSFRLDDTWTNWTEPVALEGHINSSGEETYCSITDDMSTIYFVSYRPGSDKRDIYAAPIYPDVRQYAPQIAITMPDQQMREVDVTGIKLPGIPQQGQQHTSPQQPPNSSDEAATAETAVTVPADRPIPARNAQGLYTVLPLRAVAAQGTDQREYKILRNIYFDFNQTVLKKGAYEVYLQQVYDLMVQNPSVVIKVVGHADETGSRQGNLRISQKRAQSVRQFLIEKGIAAERLQLHYLGEDEPLATNDDDREGRELNRRVDFRILVQEAP
ncbi:OmpA family protein [Cesiribacter andamanensis]|nr:OmpA family protein [Cesiribacter andamanensis]